MKIIVSLSQSDGYWVAECMNLPGCISQGETRSEALENIKEAISLYLEVAEEDNRPLPSNDLEMVEV